MELVGGYITHKIHGAGIYANIWGILMVNHIYIAAPWILWVMVEVYPNIP